MGQDTIKVGMKVTSARRAAVINGKVVALGGCSGTVVSTTRHPITRAITGVVLAPEGSTDPDDNRVVSAAWLRPVVDAVSV